jgi:hypothetical protein
MELLTLAAAGAALGTADGMALGTSVGRPCTWVADGAGREVSALELGLLLSVVEAADDDDSSRRAPTHHAATANPASTKMAAVTSVRAWCLRATP